MTFGIGAASHGKLDGRRVIQVIEPRGTTYDDQVLVVNLAKTPLRLAVYPVDVHNDVTGRLEPDVASKKPTDLGSWITLRTPSKGRDVIVPAQGQLLVPVTVHIPRNAPVGDHVSGIMVSITRQAAGSGTTPTNIDFEQRVGLQLSVRVAGQLTAALAVSDMHVTYSGSLSPIGRGTAHVTYTVRNTGTVRLGGTQTLSMRGWFGSAAPSVSVPDVPVLLPGGSATFTLDVPQVVPMGRVQADVAVTPVAAVGDADPPAQIATGSASFRAVDWALIALILLLGLLIAWFVRSRRRRPTPTPGRREKGAAPDLVGAGSTGGSSS